MESRNEIHTYVFEVFHDIEKVLGLFARVAHLVNGFSYHEVLGDLCPHILVLSRFDIELAYLWLAEPICVEGND
jgi:hypothetical protein